MSTPRVIHHDANGKNHSTHLGSSPTIETDDNHHDRHSWTVKMEPTVSPTPLLVSAGRTQSYPRSPSTDVPHHHTRHVAHESHIHEKKVSEDELPRQEEGKIENVVSTSWRKRTLNRQMTNKALVKFNYIKRQPGELSLHIGDVVTVTDNSDFDWWIGTLPSGESGMFPSNCCAIETSQTVSEASSKDKSTGGESQSKWKTKFGHWIMKQKWDTRMHVFPRTIFYLVICGVC